jgi:hypothetical protein
MAKQKKKPDTTPSRLTPTILIVGAITLAGWLLFYSLDLPLNADATIALAVAALLFVMLVRAVPYARIRAALATTLKRHDANRRQRAQQR